MQQLDRLIDPYRPAAGPPPQDFRAFMRWALEGSGPVLRYAVIAALLFGASEIAASLILKAIIDGAVAQGPGAYAAAQPGVLIFGAVFFLLLRPLAIGASSLLQSVAVQPQMSPLVLTRLFRHTLGQALTYFDNDFAGRIAQKQMQSSRAVQEVVVEVINVGGIALATLVGATLLMGSVAPWLAVVMLVWAAAYVPIIRWFIPRIRVRAQTRAAARAALSGQIVDTITNMATVKLFARGDHEDVAANAAMERYRLAAVRFGWLTAGFRITLMVFAGILPIALVGGAFFMWSAGTGSPGDVAMAGLLATRIAQMTGWVSFTFLGIFTNVGEIEDGIHTLSPGHTITDAPGALDRAPRGPIRFEDVHFAYGGDTAALDGIDLEIAEGEKVALVGASGAGKSTIVALLLRLYDVERGRVTVGGADVRQIGQDGLRGAIATVRQETAMFNRSAFDNIAYGQPDATPEMVEDAARRAGAHEFILRLKDFKGREGYAAHLGERGVKLSGGQRQRIALARAILKDAPILVLDEATSALDSEVEAAIQDALEELTTGKTVIAIAHRLSTIAAMDRIVVLEGGRIAEQGTHEALLARNGRYASFWQRQSGGFIEAAE